MECSQGTLPVVYGQQECETLSELAAVGPSVPEPLCLGFGNQCEAESEGSVLPTVLSREQKRVRINVLSLTSL